MATPRKITPQQKSQKAQKRLRFTVISRLAKALSHEFTLQGQFKLGYRNKEDVSNLPAYTLVVGSQNVLTNAAEQVVIRNGYQLDGSAGSQNTYGIDSAYDFNTRVNGIQNLRKWGTNLEVRYTNPATATTTWVKIMSSLVAANVCNFTDFWDTTFTKNLCLFVNGDLKVYKWTGAIGSFASSTATTVTLSGSSSLANLNFDAAGTFVMGGVSYAYTSAGLISASAYSQTPTNATFTITPTTWVSQLFTTGASATQVLSAAVRIHSAAISTITANFIAAIYTDNAGVPGTLVGSTTGSIPASYSSGDFDVNFTFNQTVSAATNYHLVVYILNSDGAALTVYTGASGGVGTNTSINSGSTWSTRNGYLYASIIENDSNLQTFNGVSPTPAAATVGDPVFQLPIVGTTAITNVSGFTSFDLIRTLRNQIYYGCLTNQTVYVTKVNSFTDASFATPRVVGEGASVTLDAPPVAFVPQEDGMYLSAGVSFWYRTKFTLSSDLTKESFEINRLKTSSNQGAISQSYTGKLKNSIVFVSSEPVFNSLGPVRNILADAQVINMSDSIKYDMDAYDFGGGSIHYNNYNLYFSVPNQGVVRVFNINSKYWEAPQIIPVGMFYEVEGLLYGHSALTDESYQLFVPGVYNDAGNPISAVAAFPYVSQEGAQADHQKFFNKHYTEGYISTNTALTLTINYDFGGFSGNYSTDIEGTDPKIIFNKITDGSLGENPLGSQPIGSILNLSSNPAVPKFRSIKTFAPVACYEYQIVYSSNDVDQNWALLRFGPAVGPSTDQSVSISE